MPCRRCSFCAINYPDNTLGNCKVCDQELSRFTDVDHHEDWRERVGSESWRHADRDDPIYCGPTAERRFEKTLDSLVGADDFLLECGERKPPEGHDFTLLDPPKAPDA